MRIRVRPIFTAVLATFPMAFLIALLASGARVWACAAVMFLSGISSDIFGILWSTTMQREIPEDVFSHVSSYDWLGSLAFASWASSLPDRQRRSWEPAGHSPCALLVVLATAGARSPPTSAH